MDKFLDFATAIVSLATAVVLLVVAKPRKRKKRR